MGKLNQEHDTMILMHNRRGIRIEYNLSLQKLILWISPQAGKSYDSYDRNFSNRDDHTCLFDSIEIPGVLIEDFENCDYDPFHSIIKFKNQSIHVLSIVDKPCIALWFEKSQVVDFKGNKSDSIVERSDNKFCLEHPDREYLFDFVAMIGCGKGKFRHQLQVEHGRSVYARATVEEKQLIVICGELSDDTLKSA